MLNQSGEKSASRSNAKVQESQNQLYGQEEISGSEDQDQDQGSEGGHRETQELKSENEQLKGEILRLSNTINGIIAQKDWKNMGNGNNAGNPNGNNVGGPLRAGPSQHTQFQQQINYQQMLQRKKNKELEDQQKQTETLKIQQQLQQLQKMKQIQELQIQQHKFQQRQLENQQKQQKQQIRPQPNVETQFVVDQDGLNYFQKGKRARQASMHVKTENSPEQAQFYHQQRLQYQNSRMENLYKSLDGNNCEDSNKYEFEGFVKMYQESHTKHAPKRSSPIIDNPPPKNHQKKSSNPFNPPPSRPQPSLDYQNNLAYTRQAPPLRQPEKNQRSPKHHQNNLTLNPSYQPQPPLLNCKIFWEQTFANF